MTHLKIQSAQLLLLKYVGFIKSRTDSTLVIPVKAGIPLLEWLETPTFIRLWRIHRSDEL